MSNSTTKNINGRYPVPGVLPAKLRTRNKKTLENPKRLDEGIGEAEKALASFIEEQYTDARTKTLWHRQCANEFLSRRFADIPTDDDTDVAGYVLPIVGQKIWRMVELILSELISDPEEMDFFNIYPKATEGLGPDAMRTTLLLELWLRDAIREGDFYGQIKSFLTYFAFTGNATGMWEWKQEWDNEGGEDDDMGLDADLDEMLAGYAPPADPNKLKLVRQFPSFEVPDQRNVMPSSLMSPKGMTHCEYLCLYGVMRYRDLIENEVRDTPDGKVGAYMNVDRFTPQSEEETSPISYDVFRGPQGQNGFGDWKTMWWDLGLETHTYIGPLHWEKIGGGKLTQGQVNELYRKGGSDPKKCKTKSWFLVKVVDGIVVQCQPYPYHRGEKCPFVHARAYVDEGFTMGRSFYDYNANTEEMFNYIFHCILDLVEMLARPWVTADESVVKGKFFQAKNGQVWNVPPRGIVHVIAGGNAQQAVQEQRPPVEAVIATTNFLGMLSEFAAEGTTVTKAVEGGGQQGDQTATGALQQQNFSMVPVRSQVKTLSVTLRQIVALLLDVVKEYADGELSVYVQNPTDIDRLSWYDPEVTAMVERINQEKANEIAGIVSTFTTDDFFGDFNVRVFGPATGGGKGARMEALNTAIEMAKGIEQFSPGFFRYVEAMKRYVRTAGEHDAEGLFNDPMQQNVQVGQDAGLLGQKAMIEGLMGQVGGGAPGASKPGEASPPAPRGNSTNPMAGVLGV